MSEPKASEQKKHIERTRWTCPDCGGAIEKVTEGNLVQYRCRVGHLYSPQSALIVHAAREENTLWSATVLLEEGAELAEAAAELQGDDSPEQLRAAAKAKRALAEKIKEITLEFAKISLGLK